MAFNSYKYQEGVFDFVLFILYALIIISFLGIFNSSVLFLNDIDYYFRVYICLFLIFRFHPYRKLDDFTSLDRKIIYNAGIIILTTTILNQYIADIKQKIQESKFVINIKQYIQGKF